MHQLPLCRTLHQRRKPRQTLPRTPPLLPRTHRPQSTCTPTHTALCGWIQKYQPGTVKVVAYNKQANSSLPRDENCKRSPMPSNLHSNDNIQADGEDLAFVRVQVVDKEGNLCPTATNQVTFKGAWCPGEYHSSANGDATCIIAFPKQ